MLRTVLAKTFGVEESEITDSMMTRFQHSVMSAPLESIDTTDIRDRLVLGAQLMERGFCYVESTGNRSDLKDVNVLQEVVSVSLASPVNAVAHASALMLDYTFVKQNPATPTTSVCQKTTSSDFTMSPERR